MPERYTTNLQVLMWVFVQSTHLFFNNGGIGEYRKGPGHSVCPSTHAFVHCYICLHDGNMDFFHIWYHDQVLCVADAHEIEFGSVPNSSNYGIFS